MNPMHVSHYIALLVHFTLSNSFHGYLYSMALLHKRTRRPGNAAAAQVSVDAPR